MPFPPITKDSNFDYESALDEHVRVSTSIEIQSSLHIDYGLAKFGSQPRYYERQHRSVED